MEIFDRIFICNGHYTKPEYPCIEGMNVYRGNQIHSHLYREPQKFKGEFVQNIQKNLVKLSYVQLKCSDCYTWRR